MPGGTRHRTDGSSNGKASCTSGKIRSANMASIQGRTDYSDGKAQDDSVKEDGQVPSKVRYVKTRRTPGTAQSHTEGPSRRRDDGRRPHGGEGQGLQGRSARGKVRDVLETAWPIRRDEDAVQLSGRWTVNDS
ncbi:hypothetical protein A4X09_0g7815, partial [Tilletia walkeri]